VGYEGSAVVEVVCPATSASAAANASGNCFPRLSARRRMPLQALPESEYRGGTFACKICDKEDTTAPLRYSEPLRVQNTPRDVNRPDVSKRPENDCHISPACAAEQSGDVLNNSDGWTYGVEDAGELEEESASFTVKSGASSGNRQVLAGETADDDVNGFDSIPVDGAYIVIDHTRFRESFREDILAISIYLALPPHIKARTDEAEVEAADT
jgi:hypothetical protein